MVHHLITPSHYAILLKPSFLSWMLAAIWLVCHVCKNCSFSSSTKNILSYIPKLSLSSKLAVKSLNDPGFTTPNTTQCVDCKKNSIPHNCTQFYPRSLMVVFSWSVRCIGKKKKN
ncbi:hypothetical protein V6Z12_A07G129300 [Gossypium hirsutum]